MLIVAFQVIKHVARAEGEKIFNGLLTVTNENGEIRTCHLVTTTGHAQTSLAINGLSESLDIYGNRQPEVMFTDNPPGDKQLLENSFRSSLLDGVVPVEAYEHLEKLTIPPNTTIHVKKTRDEINAVCQGIIDDLGTSADNHLVVGFDSEWNVEFRADGRYQHHGPTAVIQLAYKDCVYLLQVCLQKLSLCFDSGANDLILRVMHQMGDVLSSGRLPIYLKLLLENRDIWKVGRNVGVDFRHLQMAAPAANIKFASGMDLATMAKKRCVVRNITNTTLGDLTARVLHKRLNKNVSERASNWWSNTELTNEQKEYAALDAYAALAVYQKLDSIRLPHEPAPNAVRVGTPVMLLGKTKSSMVASGIITACPEGLSVPEGSVAIKVTQLYCRGSKIPGQRDTSFMDYGSAPFILPYPRTHLLVYQPLPEPPNPPASIQIVIDTPQ